MIIEVEGEVFNPDEIEHIAANKSAMSDGAPFEARDRTVIRMKSGKEFLFLSEPEEVKGAIVAAVKSGKERAVSSESLSDKDVTDVLKALGKIGGYLENVSEQLTRLNITLEQDGLSVNINR